MTCNAIRPRGHLPRVGWALFFLLALVGCSANSDPAEANDLAKLFKNAKIASIPSMAPPMDIALTDLDNNTVRLSEQAGKIVFLNFWTTWCPTCREEMPAMQKLHQRFANQDFVMLAVDLKESSKTVQRFAERYKLSFPILLDPKGKTGAGYGVRSIPTTFIIDKKGAIIGKVLGPRNWDDRRSVALFEHLINNT